MTVARKRRHLSAAFGLGLVALLAIPAAADEAACTPMTVAVPEALAASPLNTVVERAYGMAGVDAEFRVLPNRRTAASLSVAEVDAILISAEPRIEDAENFLPVPVPVARVTYYLASYSLGPNDVKTLEDITRYRLVLPSGFTHLANLLGHRRWVEMGTYDAILKLLRHDRANLALGTLSFARYAETQDTDLNIFPAPITPRFGYHMVRPACSDAFAKLHAALRTLVENGDMAAMYDAQGAPESAITPEMLDTLGPTGGLEPALAGETEKLLQAPTPEGDADPDPTSS
ncbi:substrate-binding periplasmic protein [Pseudokordiimonas caeni]|uniref:substrate-binding periplasmic protein n=1 Tax=Pseudokordiimonas caeni TaxID=2997908 RepID=UPI002811A609|nr:transporter substrate-binding domain-containing protein [Pseudokordiimonas caeni]